jgi:hypothetical protein
MIQYSKKPTMTKDQNWTNPQLVECCHQKIEDILKFQLCQEQYRFIIQSFVKTVDPKKSIRYIPKSIVWLNEETIVETVDDYFSAKHTTPLKSQGVLNYYKIGSDEKTTQIVVLDLTIDMWFHFDPEKPLFKYSILNDSKKLLKDYIEATHQVSESNKIISIHILPNQFDGKNATNFFIDIIRLTKNRGVLKNDFDVFDDIARCHQDIVFCLGEILNCRPYISNFTDHPTKVGTKTIYSYFPSVYDKHYLSECSRAFELFYNYWDKIGDIIAKYITPEIPDKQVTFAKVCESLSKLEKSSSSAEWQINFKENDYKNLNNRRRQIVHYISLESSMYSSYRGNNMNYEKLIEAQKEKEGLINYLIEHYQYTIDGFYHSMKLIEERDV